MGTTILVQRSRSSSQSNRGDPRLPPHVRGSVQRPRRWIRCIQGCGTTINVGRARPLFFPPHNPAGLVAAAAAAASPPWFLPVSSFSDFFFFFFRQSSVVSRRGAAAPRRAALRVGGRRSRRTTTTTTRRAVRFGRGPPPAVSSPFLPHPVREHSTHAPRGKQQREEGGGRTIILYHHHHLRGGDGRRGKMM